MTLADPKTSQTETRPEWSGINHLALVTSDMDATVRFYCAVLGARVVATVGTPQFRHYFFAFGPQCTVAFFEYVDLELEPFAKGAGVPDSRAPQFDHLSLNLPDEAALEALRNRLAIAGCEVTEVVNHGTIHSVYFTDNNGIALEASWWVIDVTDGSPDYDDSRVFADPNPVPALGEIRASGTPSHAPRTKLV
jgi:catechol 2,3-dioxygenase-like lactoylglutathione lyase family enzyme